MLNINNGLITRLEHLACDKLHDIELLTVHLALCQVYRQTPVVPIQVLAGPLDKQRDWLARTNRSTSIKGLIQLTTIFHPVWYASASFPLDARLAVLQKLCRDIDRVPSEDVN